MITSIVNILKLLSITMTNGQTRFTTYNFKNQSSNETKFENIGYKMRKNKGNNGHISLKVQKKK